MPGISRSDDHQTRSGVRQPRILIVMPDDGSATLPWQREIPFVVGVLGDFSGSAAAQPSSRSEYRFHDIDIDNIDAVTSGFGAALELSIPNTETCDGSHFVVILRFARLADFAPDAIVPQVPVLSSLLCRRTALRAQLVVGEEDDGTDARTLAELSAAVDAIDMQMSTQVDAILHDPAFLDLEGRWRGLALLVRQVETSHQLRLCVCNASRDVIERDLLCAVAYDETALYRTLQTSSLGRRTAFPLPP